jgi:hypothetical protein
MAVIDDRAMASWRDWVKEQDRKKEKAAWEENTTQVFNAYSEGKEDQGDLMAKQVGGNHYKRAHQPWEIIEEWELNYWAGNVLKYLLRYKYKNGVEDLEKAKHYLEYLIKHENS